MRFAAIVVTAIAFVSGAWAADPFTGDWKLSSPASTSSDGRMVKDGRVLIEPDNSGGYLQISETIFGEGAPLFGEGAVLRFNSRVQFDGTPGDGTLEAHLIRYVSKRIDGNTFEISVSDPDTGKITRTIRVSAAPQAHTLTYLWTDGASSPIRKLVYEKAAEGPLLETGKTVEHAFGPAATLEYRVNLRAGEYCHGKVDQKGGTINIAAYGPDGARIHGFGGPPTGERVFSLEAPVAGTYRIVLRSPANPAKNFAITVDKIVPLDQRLHSEPAKEKFTSPRIAALRKEIENGNSGAVAAFWRDIEKQGAPMVEPMEGNTADNLVTFVWRAATETRNVLVVWYPYTPGEA